MGATEQKMEIARTFTELSKIIKHSLRKEFEAIGVTMPQGIVIATLIKSGEMKLSDLSTKVNLSNSTVTGIIDRLEHQGLVLRTRSEEDRRIIYVKVTPKVKAMYQEISHKSEAIFEDLLSSGTPEELDKIFIGLKTLKKVLAQRNLNNI